MAFSIIIPHKNSPELLQRCLNSIPQKDDIQIIVVDDNSDKNIVDFDNFPGIKEKYVEVYFTTDSKGAGYARNVGLSHAKGEWILFADADDFFTENAFDIILSHVNNCSDIVFFETKSSYSDSQKHANKNANYSALIKNYLLKKKGAEDRLRFNFYVPWGKIFRHSMIIENGILFDEIIASNDVMFSTKSGFYAKTIDVDNRIIYNYSVSFGSLTNRRNKEVQFSKYLVSLRYNNFLKSIGKIKYGSLTPFYFLFKSIKYGVNTFWIYSKLGLKYKLYLFFPVFYWNINRSVLSLFKQYRNNIRDKKYIVNN